MPILRSSPSGPRIPALAIVGGLLLRRTLIRTAGIGTHVCLPDATHAWCRGGGGAGAGGGANAAAGQASVSGGGGSAGVFEKMVELLSGPTLSYTIGLGGIGVIGGVGGDGADTTLSYGGILLCTGFRGIGRGVGSSATTFVILGTGPGAIATGGDYNYQGGPSTTAFRISATLGQGGNGGRSDEAPGALGPGNSVANASADGEPGQFGSGGGGAINFNNVPAAGNKGGDGGTGFLWVYELGIALAA